MSDAVIAVTDRLENLGFVEKESLSAKKNESFPAYSQSKLAEIGSGPSLEKKGDDAERAWLNLSSFDDARSVPAPSGSHRQRSRRPSTSSSSSSRAGRLRKRGRSGSSSRERRRRARRRGRSKSKKRHREGTRRQGARSRSRSRTERRGKKGGTVGRAPPREELVARFSGKKVFLDEVGLSPEFAFREDRSGDRSLISDGGLPRQSAAFYKIKFGEVLGMSAPRNYSKEESVIDCSSSAIKLFDDAALRRDKIVIEDLRESGLMSRESNPLGIYDLATEAYLEGRNQPAFQDEKDTGSVKLHYIQQRTRRFNEKLREAPENITLWLEFVDFQDISLQDTEFGTIDNGKKKNKSGKNVVMKQKALAEKKLAILKSAIDKNPKSVELAVKRLDLSRDILETGVLDRQWKELIFVFPQNFELWRYYLRFVSSYFTSFSVSKVVKAYKSCFLKLKQLQVQSFLSPERPLDLEDQMRTILVSLCHFFARSGFREKGLAVFQAMIELNLYSPDFPGYYSLDDRLALFEPFWESRSPRFGEPGVVGWATVMKNKGSGQNEESALNTSTAEDDLIENAGNLVRRNRLWLELEVGREKRHWCPWRSSEEDAEDPDRMISYEDVAPFIFQFNEKQQNLNFAIAFLYFLGIEFFEEPFVLSCLCSETISGHLGIATTETMSTDIDWNPDIISHVLQRTVPDFAEDQSFQTFCRNVFSQISKVFAEPYRTQIISLWLQFELKVFERSCVSDATMTQKEKAKEIKELVKNLLSNDQNNIYVYMEYAKIEYKIGGFKKSWKILETALKSQNQRANVNLYLCAIGIVIAELMIKYSPIHFDLVTWLLCLGGDNLVYESTKSKMEILSLAEQVKTRLQNAIHSQLILGTIEHSEEASKLLHHPVNFVSEFMTKVYFCSWLTFFTDSPSSAIVFLDFVQAKVKVIPHSMMQKLTLENVHKLKIDHLSLAASKSNLLLRKCRDALGQALHDFSSNSYFLQSLCHLNIQPNVVDTTWRSFTNDILCHPNPSSPIQQIYATKVLIQHFAKYHDASDLSADSGSITYLNRAKALLEKFVRREPGRYSPTIWRLLLWVTKMVTTLRTSKNSLHLVDTAFYRSLQDCPSAKALYLDAVSYLHLDDTNDEQLKKLLDILGEKEGRIRLPMEELEVLLEKEEDVLV